MKLHKTIDSPNTIDGSNTAAKARKLVMLSFGIALSLALSGCVTQSPSEPVQPTQSPATAEDYSVHIVAENLNAPWSVVPLSSGSFLISERDTAEILELSADGQLRTVTTIEGVNTAGEGGLLGLAVHPGTEDRLYVYYTSEHDNRVLRYNITGDAGSYSLTNPETIIDQIPHGNTHNGGRLAFGPDDQLYIGTGDAGERSVSPDMNSLGGKILRINPDGSLPADNPFPNSAVFSLGHRNVQGIAWTSDGRMWASEFGQNTWDELNEIVAGDNYGWPTHEGIAQAEGFVDPVLQFEPAEASPSGLTAYNDTLFMASLRGERVWQIDTTTVQQGMENSAAAKPLFIGEFGRIRDIAASDDGEVWFLSNNTDGRGNPAEQDDRLYHFELTEK